MKNDLIVVKIFSSRNKAIIAQSKLRAFNVISYIEADDAGGLYPFPGKSGFGSVKLLIKNTDRIKAQKLLKRR